MTGCFRLVSRWGSAMALLAAGSTLRAEDVPLSLAQALELAGQHNPEILARRARTQAETARAEAVQRTRWPRLVLSSGWSRTNTPSMVFAEKLNAGDFGQSDFAIDQLNSPDALSHLTTSLAAEVPLDVFGRVKAHADSESAALQASSALLDESLQDLRLRVVEAYRRAALARGVTDVAERALASARAREADVEARAAEGASLPADLLRVRARRRQREADLAERHADADIALATLSHVMGADPASSYVPTERPAPPLPPDGDMAAWTSRAVAGATVVASGHDSLSGTDLGGPRRRALELAGPGGLGAGPGRPQRLVRRPSVGRVRSADAMEPV